MPNHEPLLFGACEIQVEFLEAKDHLKTVTDFTDLNTGYVSTAQKFLI